MANLVSIRQVLDDLLAHPKLKSLTLERVVNYTVHFIRMIGMPNSFLEKTERLKINEHRAALPCGFHEMKGVRAIDANGRPGGTYVYASNTFMTSPLEKGGGQLTYKVQGGVIFTSNENGEIEIVYKAMPVDEDGFPLLPDDSFFLRALELYIKKEEFTILWERGKLKTNRYAFQVLQNIQQEYAWAVGQAQSSAIRLTIDQMESLKRSLNTLVVRDNMHERGFNGLNEQERLRI